MTTALVPFEQTMSIARAMAGSGYFADSRDANQAIVKILAGQELGLGPFAAMTGIHIIKGKPVMSSNLIATLIKQDPRYDYRVTRHDDDGCTIAFFEGGEQVGESTFTAADAKAAGLSGDNWRKFPRNMYFARAISNGAKWYTPGIFGGSPVYTPDELGADVDGETGEIVVNVTPVSPPRPAEDTPSGRQVRQVEAPKANGNGQIDEWQQPVKIDTKSNLFKSFMATGNELYGDEWDDKRPQLVRHISKGQHTSSAELSFEQVQTLLNGMQDKLMEREAETA